MSSLLEPQVKLARPSSHHIASINMGLLQKLSRGGLRAVSLGGTGGRNMSSRFSVKALDHVVLTARDVPKTIEFYTQRLGMRHEVFTAQGGERHALVFGDQKINLHQAGKEFEPKAQHVQPGSGDLCFITDCPVEEVLEDWRGSGVEVSFHA
jgi:predicted enzyme related to lactoylglutathione lyase